MRSARIARTVLRAAGSAARVGAAALTVLAPALAHAAPQPERGWGMPRDVSLDGHRIDWLIQVTMVFTAILFVIMCIWMVWACIKHDEKHTAEYDHGSSAKQVKFAATLSAIIFFVVDGNLWVNSTIDVNSAFWNFDKVEADPRTLRIEVNAHQWAWDARYAGKDAKFNTADDIVVLNDIKVPVNTPILLQLASADVIHSFYLPNFRIKQDAMPGLVNRMWFQSKATGQFDIGCAQHCGTNHYKMKGVLTVLSEDEFAKWAADASASGVRGHDPNDKDAHWGWEWRVN
jgi:cytochrome c oxidase subunit 2